MSTTMAAMLTAQHLTTAQANWRKHGQLQPVVLMYGPGALVAIGLPECPGTEIPVKARAVVGLMGKVIEATHVVTIAEAWTVPMTQEEYDAAPPEAGDLVERAAQGEALDTVIVVVAYDLWEPDNSQSELAYVRGSGWELAAESGWPVGRFADAIADARDFIERTPPPPEGVSVHHLADLAKSLGLAEAVDVIE